MSLPESANALSLPLQDIARRYIGAQRQSGQALLDAARCMHEARALADHGDWKTFLEATKTSATQAKRLLDIHRTAEENADFAEAVRTDWLRFAVAADLAQESTPAALIDGVLNAEERPTRADVRNAKAAIKSTTVADLNQATLPDMPAPAQPTDLPLEYAIIQRRYIAQGYQLLSNIQGQHRAFVTRKEGMTGVVTFGWADVLSKLERLEARAAPPPTDGPQMAEWWDVKARWTSLGWELTTRGDLRYCLMPSAGGVGTDNMTWYAVLGRLEAQEKKASESAAKPTDAPAPPALIIIPPYPTNDTPALLESIRFVLRSWPKSTHGQGARALALLRAIAAEIED